MPPKPFKPPRPSTIGAPKKTTPSTSRKSTSTASKPKAVSKTNPKSSKASASTSRIPNLPSLSPDSVSADSDPDQPSGSDASENDDPFASQPSNSKTSRPREQADNDEAVGIEDEEDDRQEKIPEDLLSVLLHEFFKEKGKGGTRISKDANKAVGKYMETFVREALARAAWAREEGGMEGLEGGGGFLEVEDLERLAPQLLLDF